jgi:hypothetical protein
MRQRSTALTSKEGIVSFRLGNDRRSLYTFFGDHASNGAQKAQKAASRGIKGYLCSPGPVLCPESVKLLFQRFETMP